MVLRARGERNFPRRAFRLPGSFTTLTFYPGRHSRLRMEGRLSIRRIVPWILAAVLLVIMGALGAQNGIAAWSDGDAETILQHSVTIFSLIYGSLGLVAGVGVLLRRRWGYLLSIAWGIASTYTGGLASHAYGGTTPSVTAIATLLSAAIAGFVIWLANLATRHR